MMRARIILISIAVLLIVTGLFLSWRAAHPPKKKIIFRKRAAARPPAAGRIELPRIQKKFSNPKVAIVMDDFGYNKNNLEDIFSAKEKITFSVLPNLPYSRKVAQIAQSMGYEVILHLPLESNDRSAPTEEGTINTGMSESDVMALLEKDIAGVPGLKGVSNHQGSRATEDKALVTVILRDLKKRNLYFFDSFVTDKSVCRDAAKRSGVPYARRDMFLDNTNSRDYIEKQILSLRRFAFRKGSAIAVCHDRKNTIRALRKIMPLLAAEGIVFVSLSDMIE